MMLTPDNVHNDHVVDNAIGLPARNNMKYKLAKSVLENPHAHSTDK